MQRIMQNNAAVFRNGTVLKEGVRLIDETYQTLKDIKVTDRSMIWYVLVVVMTDFSPGTLTLWSLWNCKI